MELNKQNVKRLKELILYTIIILVALLNYRGIISILGWIFGLILPFLLGGAIAFILNVPMRFIEKRLQIKRFISLILTMIAVLGVLAIVTFLVVPELGRTIAILNDSIPGFIADMQRWAEDVFAQYPGIIEQIAAIEFDWNKIGESIFTFLRSGASSVLNSTVSAAMSILSGVATFFISIVFSIYILLQKEKLGSQINKLLVAFLPEEKANKIIRIAVLTEKIFSKFLSGQCTEAVILGLMFFITLTVCGFPYALMIGALIAFTALIPIFGAFIGCAVGAFLILMINPIQAFWFIVIFLVLQQLEGNFIYPYVVGNSVGLPSIWVLVAVTLGGSTLGIVGMLIFIPLSSVLYFLLRENVYKKLEKKRKEQEVEEEDTQ